MNASRFWTWRHRVRTPSSARAGVAEPYLTFRQLGQHGFLGNQLFQIAATVGVARRNGLPFVFPEWALSRYFQHPPAQSSALPGDLPEIRERTFAFQQITIDRTASLLGYFQSEKYFGGCEDEVRRLFAPRTLRRRELRERFAPLLERPSCSLHVRRGDYVGNPVWVDLDAEGYYERAMSQFGRDVRFVVFSDDVEWCRRRFPAARCVFVEGLEPWDSIALMSLCDAHVIANSSFSWWGAWLDPRPNATVIAPRAWFAGGYADPSEPFQPGPPHRGFHDTRDLIPERWLRL